MQTSQHDSAERHPHDSSVDECPNCGCRSWPDFAVVSRHLWSRASLGPGFEERTSLVLGLAPRLPQVEADAVYCERCTLELDLAELSDEPPSVPSDNPSWPPSPFARPVWFRRDRVVECPDCGKKHWAGFAVALQYLVELDRLEGARTPVARLRERAWSFAPDFVDYQLCDRCTEAALTVDETEPTVERTVEPEEPLFALPEVSAAVEAWCESIFPKAA
jgi:hypothetical protein